MRTPQAPIPSGFDAFTTAADVLRGVDLRDKTAIVTGGYSGLGRETVRVLLLAGARVIVPTRDVPRAKAALAHIDGADVQPMDLLDPASIDAFAARFLATEQPLHLLVNSAGIMALPELTRDARGFEAQFATNHLGHVQLVAKLWPALCRAQGARVVSVSSLGHRFSPVVFDDLHYQRRPYDPFGAYGQSKTANILFAVALDERGKDHGVRAFSLHPGSIVGTGLDRHVPIAALEAVGMLDADGKPIIAPTKGFKTVEQGAATQVWCATSPQLAGKGGVYCENVDIAPLRVVPPGTTFAIRDASIITGVLDYAVDPEAAAHLWEVSRALLGLGDLEA
ncbi:SDR family NAD(P)-dependent oxidoreductase [Chondromyces crocatus]|uniref:Probable oxidoreductase n=1 Tax=Chondromyces crocatus TaxID=52 RepID=A0A0K1EIV5_CHOCO|nr:SDR family NAD(P)-dependent oxidoreductase [Chondromyces crocatus]AKT40794.1 oxidoreductase [Chondromyces crocatus]